jgi:hypothetical protein
MPNQVIFVIGAAVAIVSMVPCIIFAGAGAGHGTYLPIFALFGPAALAGPGCILAAPVLYGLYAIVLVQIRARRRSGLWFLFGLQAHYAAMVAWSIYTRESWSHSTLLISAIGWPITIATLLWFAALHYVAVMIAFGPKAAGD